MRLARRPRLTRKATSDKRRLLLESLEDRTLLSVNLGTGFAGMDITNNSCNCVPPDTNAAVGPTHVVEMVNSAIAIYTKGGSAVAGYPQSLATFFAPVGPSSQGNLFDPVVFFDDIASRFVVGTLDVNFSAKTSNFLFAVSDSSDPTVDTNGDGRTFTEMRKINTKQTGQGGPKWSDFPRAGYNADLYTFNFNMFSFGSGSFSQIQDLRIRKSTVTDVNNGTFTSFVTTIPYNNINFTLVPARQHGSVAGDPVWMVEENGYQNGGSLRVARVTNANSGSPTFTYFTVSVPSYGATPAATSSGGVLMDAGDTRMLDAALRSSRLIVTQTVGTTGAGSVADARIYEISVSGASPSLTQTINTTSGGSGIHTYYPSADLNGSGTIGWTFMRSSSAERISMYVGGQVSGGAAQVGVVAQAGEVDYSSFDAAPKRAGDYSGTSVDPTDGSFWSANEYAKNVVTTVATWGTHIRNFTVTAGAGPTLADAAPASLAGDENQSGPVPASPASAVAVILASAGTDQSASPAAPSGIGESRSPFTRIRETDSPILVLQDETGRRGEDALIIAQAVSRLADESWASDLALDDYSVLDLAIEDLTSLPA